MSHEMQHEHDEDGAKEPWIVSINIARCNELILEMTARLRSFVQAHFHEDEILARAQEILNDHDEAFDPLAFERGECGRANLLFLRLGSLLEKHPTAGPHIRRLLELEDRVRFYTIGLLRQSHKLGGS